MLSLNLIPVFFNTTHIIPRHLSLPLCQRDRSRCSGTGPIVVCYMVSPAPFMFPLIGPTGSIPLAFCENTLKWGVIETMFPVACKYLTNDYTSGIILTPLFYSVLPWGSSRNFRIFYKYWVLANFGMGSFAPPSLSKRVLIHD